MKRKKIIFLLIPLVLFIALIMMFYRPIDYFENIKEFLITEVRFSEGLDVPTLSSEELLVLLKNHEVRRSLNLTRVVTSFIPLNDYIIIEFLGDENGGRRSMVIDLELSTVWMPTNTQGFVDYYLIDPDQFIGKLLNFN